jgi:hypothetical protein
MNPDQMKSATGQVMATGHLTGSNPYAKHFNVPLDSKAIEVQAELLPSPAIQFGGNVREEPGNDGRLQWRPNPNRKFLIGGQCEKWLLVNYARCIDDRTLK